MNGDAQYKALLIFFVALIAFLVMALLLTGCTSTDATVVTEGQARIQGSVNALANAFVEAKAELAVDVAAIQSTVTSTAGRDVNAFDYWGFRLMVGGIMSLMLLNRVLNWRRRRRSNGRA